jgi:hypothetical protein
VKASVGVSVVIILALIGTVVATYSYTQLQQEDVLFYENSMQLDGESYRAWQAGVIIGNYFYIFSPKIVGSVDIVGTGVDFYLVDYTSWDSWKTEIKRRSALSVVYLNSDALSSQSAQGQFSFTNLDQDLWIIVLVNSEYPNPNNANVHVNITFQYISLFNFCAFVAGLAMLGIAIVSLLVMTRRKAQQ